MRILAFVVSAIIPVLILLSNLPQAPIAAVFGNRLHLISQVRVIFGGDMMFDRSIRKTIDEYGGNYIFSCIDETLKGADFIIANLEGPITENLSISASSTPGDGKNYTFTFATSTAPLLFAHNIRIVNLGNNHIQNFGVDGVLSTISLLSNSKISFFGDPISDTILEIEAKKVKLAFIGYNEFSSKNISHPGEGSASTSIMQVESERANGYLPIVYTHWGVEYATTSPERIQKLAHRFIDAGAEIVIGSHPHVVEENEIYKGKNIYYSLGNFIFDQYFSVAVRHGLLLQVIFGKVGVLSIKEVPIELGQDRRTCPVG